MITHERVAAHCLDALIEVERARAVTSDELLITDVKWCERRHQLTVEQTALLAAVSPPPEVQEAAGQRVLA